MADAADPWERLLDPESGYFYWFNNSTGESTWELEDSAGQQDHQPEQPTAKEHRDPKGSTSGGASLMTTPSPGSVSVEGASAEDDLDMARSSASASSPAAFAAANALSSLGHVTGGGSPGASSALVATAPSGELYSGTDAHRAAAVAAADADEGSA